MPRLVAVGRVGRPHGLKGELRLDPGSGLSEGLGRYSQLFLRRGERGEAEPVSLESARPNGRLLLVKFAGIDTPEAAQALVNRDLCVDRAELPALEPDEYYHSDLLGCAVRDEGGEDLGRVLDVFATAAHDVLVIRTRGRDWMLPVTEACVLEMDLEAGEIRVRVPEGLRD